MLDLYSCWSLWICLVWLLAISLLWNILLSNKHMFWIGSWELLLHRPDYSHILPERKKQNKKLWESQWLKEKNKVHLDTFQPCCANSLFQPSTQANSKNHCQSYCCLDHHHPMLRLGKPLWRCDGKIPHNPLLPLMAGFGKAKEKWRTWSAVCKDKGVWIRGLWWPVWVCMCECVGPPHSSEGCVTMTTV